MMSGHGTIETAVKATKLGAFDFIEKPLSLEKVILVVNHALEMVRLEEENLLLKQKVSHEYELTGNSGPIQDLKEMIGIVAPTNAWILIMGENGTGKELVARSIHRQSRRAQKPFIEVNCAAIPEDLIESELFGHERGAFTGATAMKRGKFDLANEGTIFLDEVADMSLKAQAKVLRILQEKKFERVGGNKLIPTDVRVLAATNKDLEKEMEEGRFRQDLYYRLNVIPLRIPPLRDRKEDIPLLVDRFLKDFALKEGEPEKQVTEEVLAVLMRHNWPGNVRELKNIIERLVIMTPTRVRFPNAIFPRCSRKEGWRLFLVSRRSSAIPSGSRSRISNGSTSSASSGSLTATSPGRPRRSAWNGATFTRRSGAMVWRSRAIPESRRVRQQALSAAAESFNRGASAYEVPAGGDRRWKSG